MAKKNPDKDLISEVSGDELKHFADLLKKTPLEDIPKVMMIAAIIYTEGKLKIESILKSKEKKKE